MDDDYEKIMILACIIIFCAVSFFLGANTGEYSMKKEAVKNGVARWVESDKNGNPPNKFEWIITREKQ